MTAPRLEVDLQKIEHNARTLVGLLAAQALSKEPSSLQLRYLQTLTEIAAEEWAYIRSTPRWPSLSRESQP